MTAQRGEMQSIANAPMLGQGDELLQVTSLVASLHDGARIVDNVSFSIRQGETFALLGESGCGKSMTALSLMRLLPEALHSGGGKAVLSYIGVGVDPTTNSFGNMINTARLEMAREPVVWWSLAAAFGFMLLLVLAANLFADVVRDAFDPRLHRAETA